MTFAKNGNTKEDAAMISKMLKLNDGNEIPRLGYGVWQIANDTAGRVVEYALKTGYRSIDTAAIYNNEDGVGRGIQASGVPREEIFLTTKLWNSDQGYDSAMKAMELSLKKLRVKNVDLYLVHWPSPRQDKYVPSWKALIKMKEQGLAKSIGVSNFSAVHLQRLLDETGITPTVNQVELHPWFQQRELRAFHAKHGIATESWSPLAQGKMFSDDTIGSIAGKHGKTPAQVIIRWHLQSGLIVIPKTETPARIEENFKVFDFDLTAEDMASLGNLDDPNGRIGPDPETAAF